MALQDYLMLAKVKIDTLVIFLIALGFSFFIQPIYANDSKKVVIYLRDDVYDDYMTFLAGRDPSDITSFVGPKIRRDVVDMVLAQQALAIGGYKKSFSYS